MKKDEAEKVKNIIDSWLSSVWLFRENKRIKSNVAVSPDEGFGVKVKSDPEWFDLLWSTEEGNWTKVNPQSPIGIEQGTFGGLRSRLEDHINAKMGWKKKEHVFEPTKVGELRIY